MLRAVNTKTMGTCGADYCNRLVKALRVQSTHWHFPLSAEPNNNNKTKPTAVQFRRRIHEQDEGKKGVISLQNHTKHVVQDLLDVCNNLTKAENYTRRGQKQHSVRPRCFLTTCDLVSWYGLADSKQDLITQSLKDLA